MACACLLASLWGFASVWQLGSLSVSEWECESVSGWVRRFALLLKWKQSRSQLPWFADALLGQGMWAIGDRR